MSSTKTVRVPFRVGDVVKHGTSSTHYTVHTIYASGITLATSTHFVKAQPEDLKLVKRSKKAAMHETLDGQQVDPTLDLKLTVPMIRRTMKVDKSLKHFTIQAVRLLSVATTTFVEELGGLIDETAAPADFVPTADGAKHLNITYDSVRRAIHSQEQFKFARAVVPMKEEDKEKEFRRNERIASGLPDEEEKQKPVIYKAGMEPVIAFVDPGPDEDELMASTTTTTTSRKAPASSRPPRPLPPPEKLIRANISARIKAQPIKKYGTEVLLGNPDDKFRPEIDRSKQRQLKKKKVKTWKRVRVKIAGKTYDKLSDLPRGKRKRPETTSSSSSKSAPSKKRSKPAKKSTSKSSSKSSSPLEIWSPYLKFTGKRSDPTCQGSGGLPCDKKAGYKWRSNLKRKDEDTNRFKFEEWNCCEECGVDEFGGWYEVEVEAPAAAEENL
ncbi:hypothetical protein TrVE_jg3363 [Triparma verrucosa]|uniref:Uncharacterized protein n=1 Tax=Triparma verrucosa TaxID=1606542 RepID=A0A9W7FPG3_9STRA|nr:hypothetical protein TrVE_jg3363 [Triparma verrucosa]